MTDLIKASVERIEAQDAALQAAVQIIELDGCDISSISLIIESVWGGDQVPQQHLIKGLAHAGNVVLVALKDHVPVGFSLGYLGWTGGFHMHSHMTAASPGHRSAGVGFALKMRQRAICLENGVHEIRWTYDPLIARNANFNLRKLGAKVICFLPDFYQDMDDKINMGDRSDRFEVAWDLNSERTQRALKGQFVSSPQSGHSVSIHPDFESLRATDMKQAHGERERTRDSFQKYFANGYLAEWDPAGSYVFNKAEPVLN